LAAIAADVPSAGTITAALAADTHGDQLLIPADDRAANITTRFGALVPVPYVPELLGMLAQGPVSPRDLWEVAARIDSRTRTLFRPFIDWCQITVAMGAGADNPLRDRDSTPLAVATMDQALGAQCGAIRDQDFPLTTAPLATPAISATVLLMPWWLWAKRLVNKTTRDRPVGMPKPRRWCRCPTFGSPALALYSTSAKWPTTQLSPQFGPGWPNWGSSIVGASWKRPPKSHRGIGPFHSQWWDGPLSAPNCPNQ
jgi:hypothetical protein